MFANREEMERRSEVNAEEWRKAKAVWRRFGVIFLAIAIAFLMALAYAAGDLNDHLACINSARPERVTP